MNNNCSIQQSLRGTIKFKKRIGIFLKLNRIVVRHQLAVFAAQVTGLTLTLILDGRTIESIWDSYNNNRMTKNKRLVKMPIRIIIEVTATLVATIAVTLGGEMNSY